MTYGMDKIVNMVYFLVQAPNSNFASRRKVYLPTDYTVDFQIVLCNRRPSVVS